MMQAKNIRVQDIEVLWDLYDGDELVVADLATPYENYEEEIKKVIEAQ